MDTTVWVLIIALIVVAVAFGAGLWLTVQRNRSDRLRRQFGPEYERALEEHRGDRRAAEASLADRRERVEKLRLRALTKEDRARFSHQWDAAQAQFVDDPAGAVHNAQLLVDAAMKTRGFPLGDFEQRAADISVEHPAVVENYRSARRIADANVRGEAETEDLRQAMVHYRELFQDLVNAPGEVEGGRREREQRRDSRVRMREQSPRGR